MGMGNRRRRGNGLSRRHVLAGSFITAGGALMLSDTGAVSQLAATRGAAIGTSADETALLGLDVPSLIRAGSEDEPLVTVTNNAEASLDVSIELVDPLESESVSPAETTALETGQSVTFTAYIDPGRDGGSNAVTFDINATDNESLVIDLRRRISLPTLKRRIIDNTQDDHVTFDVQYRIRDVPGFSRMELEVENTGPRREGLGEEFTRTEMEGVISYPEDNGDSDEGAGGDSYDFTFTVFDENDSQIIDETVTTVADGESDGDNDDLRSDDDPKLDWFTVEDRSSRSEGTILEVDYTVEETEKFERVLVTFDTDTDSGGHWADETKPNTADNGTVTHTNEGTYGSTYDVTVEVENQSGLIVDSGTVTIESGSNQTFSWP